MATDQSSTDEDDDICLPSVQPQARSPFSCRSARASAQDQDLLGSGGRPTRARAASRSCKCAAPKQGLCGTIVWISEPNDKQGKPQTDQGNKNAASGTGRSSACRSSRAGARPAPTNGRARSTIRRTARLRRRHHARRRQAYADGLHRLPVRLRHVEPLPWQVTRAAAVPRLDRPNKSEVMQLTTGLEGNRAAHSTFVMSLSKDGRSRVAVVRQAHHWGGGNRAEPAAFVLSLSKDGRSRLAVVRQAHHGVGSPSPCTTRSP